MNTERNEIVASVVVIVHNNPRIKDCLNSLINQTFSLQKWELIVVDNASTDKTPQIIQQYPVKLLTEATKGMGWARNKGLSEAKGKYTVFIDADCVAESDWLEQLLRGFVDEKIGAIGGKILKQTSSNVFERATRDVVIGQQTKPQYLPMFSAPYVVTGNVAYRTDVLRQIEGFDPILFSGADVDISWRIAIAGYKIVTRPQAVVYHANQSSSIQYFRQFYRYGLGHAELYKKYRKITKQRFLINKYPFIKLFKLFICDIPNALFKSLIKKYTVIDWIKIYLNFIEYIALICGDIHGAIKFRIPYI